MLLIFRLTWYCRIWNTSASNSTSWPALQCHAASSTYKFHCIIIPLLDVQSRLHLVSSDQPVTGLRDLQSSSSLLSSEFPLDDDQIVAIRFWLVHQYIYRSGILVWRVQSARRCFKTSKNYQVITSSNGASHSQIIQPTTTIYLPYHPNTNYWFICWTLRKKILI